MKKKHILNIIIIILFVIFAYWKITSSRKKQLETLDKLSKEYTNLSINDSINNVVNSTYFPPEWGGQQYAQYITFKDKTKYYFDIKESITENALFGDIVSFGDSIAKQCGSDTIYLYSNGEEYVFLIRIKK
jgi:alanyl-tRNA synthetase